ncbi:MAG: hypothetical protein Q3974_00415 [Rothia sp. (in: high G+C Gram-positive bacteria)]|nr:hypothetical protein [Rothia sp. (in: high G+C Gram-positive bacteria)]
MSNSSNKRPIRPATHGVGQSESRDQKEVIAELSKVEAHQVKNEAVESGKNVAQHAKNVAGNVKDETVSQAQDLVGQLRDDLQRMVGPQQQKIAATVRTISDEIDALSRGEKPQSDYVTGLLGSASGYVNSVATSLEQKEPKDLLNDVRRFAARRPGVFLAAALGVGILAGRATRNAAENEQVPSSAEEAKEYFGMQDQGARTQTQASQNNSTQNRRTQDPTAHDQHNDLTAHNIPGAGFTAEGGNRR